MSTDARARRVRAPAGDLRSSSRGLPVWAMWAFALGLCAVCWAALGAALYMVVAG